MSSGAFAFYIDQAAGGGPNALIRRVIPLPPTSGGDAINFNQGRLSLAYDDFGAGTGPVLTPIMVRVRILTDVTVRLDQSLQVFPGRTVVSEIQAGDVAASFEVAAGIRPALTALVEYND